MKTHQEMRRVIADVLESHEGNLSDGYQYYVPGARPMEKDDAYPNPAIRSHLELMADEIVTALGL